MKNENEHRMSRGIHNQIGLSKSNDYPCVNLSYEYAKEIADELTRLHRRIEELEKVAEAARTLQSCKSHVAREKWETILDQSLKALTSKEPPDDNAPEKEKCKCAHPDPYGYGKFYVCGKESR